MSLKVFLQLVWIWSVVEGCTTDPAFNNCTTIYQNTTQAMDRYCHVECGKATSQSSCDHTDLNKTRGYSGYAAVAAKIRFQKQLLEEKARQILESSKVSRENDFSLYVILVVASILCAMSLMAHMPLVWDSDRRKKQWIDTYYSDVNGKIISNETDRDKELSAWLFDEDKEQLLFPENPYSSPYAFDYDFSA